MSKTILTKINLVCDLTNVPMSATTETDEVTLIKVRRKLISIVDAQKSNRPLKSEYKYDRIIGYNEEGMLQMYPMSAASYCESSNRKFVLLSELRCDADVFYACSAPVVQTGEKNVRAIYIPAITLHQVEVTSGFDLMVDEEYIFDNRRVRCKYGKSYYGAMSHAYMLSIFYDDNNCKAWDKYAEQVLTGEWFLRDGVASLFVGKPSTEEAKPMQETSTRQGREFSAGSESPDVKAKDFWDCIDKIH